MDVNNKYKGLKGKLFNSLDFTKLLKNSDFKEDSVREVIILPILNALGYTQKNIIRSKTLQHPFLKIGSKKRPVNLVPDYIMQIESNFAWVLDAKAPHEKIVNADNVEQVYSYAVHPEIRATYFVLCNGVELSLYRPSNTDKPILFFNLENIELHWEKLKFLLSPDSFQTGKKITYETTNLLTKHKKFSYTNRPLLEEIPVRKRAAKRHFGVHGYFTKQTWNVVAEYIKNFSKPGDVVLDSFSGSGITPIEAMMNNRKAISIDLNPLAVFLVKALIAPVNYTEFAKAFERITQEYEKKEPKTKIEIKQALKNYPYPKGVVLPKSSDVSTIEKLFSNKQLAQLALLKSIIKKEKNDNIRNTLLLMFSGLLTKVNLTYHTSTYVKKEGGGNAAPFQYYRYRIAPNPVEVDVMKYFKLRFKKIWDAKKEMEYFINEDTVDNIQILKGSATDLSWLPKESIDYIYTDPPYGKKIPYLDLSVMWNSWLDLDVSQQDRDLEAIENGEQNKSKEEYNILISQSIKEMYRVLKFDRWMSFVFAHKDPEFWHLIIDTAESCGFEYMGAVPQKNGQTSFKKRQHPFTVLSGQLIINFRKVRNPRTIMNANLGMNIGEIVFQTIEGIIAKNNGATLEQINDELIIKGLELGFLDLLKKEYSDLTPLLLQNFDYCDNTEVFTIKHDKSFTTHVDVKLRIKYYLISFLRRKERENVSPHFDEIILYIMPLLKNGKTPKNETILSVLEDIAVKIADDCWKLRQNGQKLLFPE